MGGVALFSDHTYRNPDVTPGFALRSFPVGSKDNRVCSGMNPSPQCARLCYHYSHRKNVILILTSISNKKKIRINCYWVRIYFSLYTT